MFRVFAAWAVLAVGSAEAGYDGPLLNRVTVTGSGAEVSQSQCTIYPDRIREAKTVGGALELEETRQVEVAAASVVKKINEAAQGKIRESLGRNNGKTQIYRAIHVERDGNIRAVVLGQQGKQNIVNDSGAAASLKSFIDASCK